MNKYDVIIIGAGVAGLTAAIYAKRAGKTVLILEEKAEGGQIINSFDVENWPGEIKISGVDLTHKITSQVKNLGVETGYEEVLEITRSAEYLTDADANNNTRACWNIRTDETEYLAGAIIIATGTNPRKMSAEQTASAGKRPISYCATCDGALYKNKPVVVVGHGNSAKHEVKYLENICSKVYQIHHDDPIPEDAAAVFVAIGRVPNTSKFEDLVSLDEDGFIVADETCKTSTDGIFVAGDCRKKPLRQLVTAASDGAVAATVAVSYLG